MDQVIFSPVFTIVGQFFIFLAIAGFLFGFFGDLNVKWQQALFILTVIFLMILFGVMALATFFHGLNAS